MPSAKEMAYMRVFGIKDDSVLNNPEHQSVLRDATADIMSYTGLYENETALDRDRRLEIDTALSGESVDIADYFKSTFPNKYTGLTSWDVVFRVYKDMHGVDKTEDREKTVQALMGQTVGEQADQKSSEAGDHLINKSTSIDKEEEEMSTTSNLDAALENLKTAGGLTPQDEGAALPTVDDATKKAALDATSRTILNQRNERIAYSRGACVTRGIAMQPSLAKRVKPNAKAVLVKDGNADTAAKKAEKIYKNFCEKTGRRVTDSGVAVYDNVRNDSVEEAMKVDVFLQELKNDPTKQLEMQAPSTSEQLKGGYLRASDHPEEVAMTTKELLQIILEKTLGRLNTSVPESQFSVRKAFNRTTAATGAQGSEAVSTTADPWKGVAIVSVIHKAEFEKAGLAYAYEIKSDEETQTGVRIQLPGKVYYKKNNGATTDENAEVKYTMFTVTGFAPAYATVLNPDLKKFERKERSSAGSDNSRVLDFNNNEDVEAALGNLNNVVASYLAANKGNVPEGASSLFKDAANLMHEAASAAVAQEVGAMEGIDA